MYIYFRHDIYRKKDFNVEKDNRIEAEVTTLCNNEIKRKMYLFNLKRTKRHSLTTDCFVKIYLEQRKKVQKLFYKRYYYYE